MELTVFSALAIASAINSAIPGPCVALTIARSARDGLVAGLVASLGVVLSNLFLAALALSIMLGVVTLSENAFVAMKWAGAGVLILLALNILFPGRKSTVGQHASKGAQFYDFVAGLTTGLASPFNLVFLLALLPQMVPTSALHVFGLGMTIAAILAGCAVSLFGFTLLGTLSGGAIQRAGRPIECLGALAMIGFAATAMMTPIA
ncbi:MAG: LysE family transporter [Alphaproteobacteria bacterium]|nr:LysE family transporter [Alphaproteobacteria bacterium]